MFTKGKVKTRSLSGPLGSPAPLSEVGGLHDAHDVLSAVRYESQKEDCSDEKDAIDKVINQVESRFKMVNPSLPLLERRVIFQKLERLLESEKKYRNRKMSAKQSKPFLKQLPKLFDIIACHCKIIACSAIGSCSTPKTCSGYHVICSCFDDKKIPDLEVSFVKDQREKVGTFGGNQIMGNVDKKEATLAKKQQDKKEKI